MGKGDHVIAIARWQQLLYDIAGLALELTEACLDAALLILSESGRVTVHVVFSKGAIDALHCQSWLRVAQSQYIDHFVVWVELLFWVTLAKSAREVSE
jgi:hypothetical protein